MKVKIPNAFTINKLGTRGGIIPFPLSITNFKGPSGVHCMSLSPQSVYHLCDILENFERIVVFEVSVDDFDPQTGHFVPLSEEAAASQVSFQEIDSGTIVISGNSLCGLLTGLEHWNFHAFDVQNSNSEDEIIECVLTYYEHEWSNRKQFLSYINHSIFFLDSHDDCYLYLESYDVSLQKRIFGRALQIYSGTVLFEVNNYIGEIAGLPEELIDAIWPVNSSLTILQNQTSVEETKLRIGISQMEFSFGEKQEYPVSSFLQYDASDEVWGIL